MARNQFGDQTLTITKTDSPCVPAAKNMIQSSLLVNHFKCYRVRQRGFQERTVTVTDQFETRTATLVKPLLFCNPVDKNGEGILDPNGHITCYKIESGGPAFVPQEVNVLDQFGALDLRSIRGSCRKADILCVPSVKNPM